MSIKNGRAIARRFKELNLNPVPVGKDKIPLRKGHNTELEDSEIDNYDFNYIGVSTGAVSGGLEVLDFDLKNSEEPEKVLEAFRKRVPKSLLNRLVVQTTMNDGFHYIYRCEDISSSKKLAKNSKGLAVIETRGEGGYIKCYPSEGYTMVGDKTFSDIPIITPEERVTLFVSAKLLNETTVKDSSKRVSREDLKAFQRFPEYNTQSNVGISLLKKHGWLEHSEDEDRIFLTRPNKSIKDGISAAYFKKECFLFVFSTSQDEFETERPYNNHAIFAELECDSDYNEAYGKLYDAGHGIDMEDEMSEKKSNKKEWKDNITNLDFLSDEVEENTYLEQARKNEIEQGLPTGWTALDKFYRLKENTLDFGIGYDGVGKSVFMLSVAQASIVQHDWVWGGIMPENKTGMTRRRLIEAASGKLIENFKGSRLLFSKYLEESRKSFHIMSNKKHYSIKEVIEMGKRLYEEYGINALLIDPYNFFKVEGAGYSHNNEVLSQLRVFAERYCSVFVMGHPNSNTARNNLDTNGYLMAPTKYDVQGGADFAYRVDNFFTTHRITNHSDDLARREMQIKIEKIKELETGGKVHGKDDYVGLTYQERNGFLGYWDENGDNPMYKALVAKRSIRGISPEEAFE
jgi:hypothetical protein